VVIKKGDLVIVLKMSLSPVI